MQDPELNDLTSSVPASAEGAPAGSANSTTADLALSPHARPRPGLAWLAIFGGVALVVWLQNFVRPAVDQGQEEGASHVVMEFQSRCFVGLRQLLPMPAEQWWEQAQQLAGGSIGQRLRYAVLAGEMVGPELAYELLEELDDEAAELGVALPEDEARVRALLDTLYASDPAKAVETLDPVDRQFLQDQLDWFGRLALAPPGGPDPALRSAVLDEAGRTVLVYIGGLAVVGVCGLVGFFAWIVLAILLLAGHWPGRFARSHSSTGIYAETFALWLAFFMALNIAASLAPATMRLGLLAVAMLVSLQTLAWPVWRGIPLRTVCRDLGLSFGQGPVREVLAGVVSYAMTLPLVAVGLVLTLVLIVLQSRLVVPQPGGGQPFQPHDLPSHPIVDSLVTGDWLARVQIVLLATVAAPVVEEIMFRGVLYRHLRSATEGIGRALSVLASATLSGFVFAVVHPQGWVAVPVLMSIAYGLALAREWRDSLLAGMVLHGINNGLVTGLLILAMGR